MPKYSLRKEIDMGKRILRIHSVEPGFCRINYTVPGRKGAHYCLQEDFDDIKAYRSSPDWEPDSEVVFDKGQWEIPRGDSDIETKVRNCLEGN